MEVFDKIDKTYIPEKYLGKFKEFVEQNELIFKKCGSQKLFKLNNVIPFLEKVILECLHSENDVKLVGKFYRDLIVFIGIFMEDISSCKTKEMLNNSDSDSDLDELEKEIDKEIDEELLDLENKLINFLPNLNKMRNKYNKVCSKWVDSENDLMSIDFCKNCLFFKSRHNVCKRFSGFQSMFAQCDFCGLEIEEHNVCQEFIVGTINDDDHYKRKYDICVSCGLSRKKHYILYEKLGKTHCKSFETNEYGSCKNCIFDFQSHLVGIEKSDLQFPLDDMKDKIKKGIATQDDINLLDNIKNRLEKEMDKKMVYVKSPPNNWTKV